MAYDSDMNEHRAPHELVQKIEAILFSEGGPVSLKKIAQIVGVEELEVQGALQLLSESLAHRGITLVVSHAEAVLVVAESARSTIEGMYERELGKEIGEAGLEVLAILLYRGPSTRAQIDYIRGVNTSSTIRTLIARGLVERISNPHDAREYVYRPTTEALAYLGVTRVEDLPEYGTITRELAMFEKTGPFAESHGGDPAHRDTATEASTGE